MTQITDPLTEAERHISTPRRPVGGAQIIVGALCALAIAGLVAAHVWFGLPF